MIKSEELRAKRLELMLSQARLAEMAGCHVNYVGWFEGETKYWKEQVSDAAKLDIKEKLTKVIHEQCDAAGIPYEVIDVTDMTADQLKEKRDKIGLTIEQVSAETGISVSHVDKVERIKDAPISGMAAAVKRRLIHYYGAKDASPKTQANSHPEDSGKDNPKVITSRGKTLQMLGEGDKGEGLLTKRQALVREIATIDSQLADIDDEASKICSEITALRGELKTSGLVKTSDIIKEKRSEMQAIIDKTKEKQIILAPVEALLASKNEKAGELGDLNKRIAEKSAKQVLAELDKIVGKVNKFAEEIVELGKAAKISVSVLTGEID